MAFSVMNALDSVPTMESIGEMEKKDLSKRTRSSVKTPKQVESVKIYNAVTPRYKNKYFHLNVHFTFSGEQ